MMRETAIEGAARQAEGARGVGDVAAVAVERALDEVALGLVEREVVEALAALAARAGAAAAEEQIGGVHDIGGAQEHGALDDVLELAHVARPRMLVERGHGVGAERDAAAVARGVAIEEVRREQRNVLAPLAQR